MSKAATKRPAFLITIDTEGDNLWSKPREISTRNSAYLPRFQQLCERYDLRPTYLTNWEMIECPVFVEFARDVIRRNVAEIGMHLHAWNSPPISPLTDDDFNCQPYLVEYPLAQIREKVRVLTDKLEQTLGVKMLSHRAGRWSFDGRYARVLLDHGYQVDCSVAPHTSYASHLGNPRGAGGTDYTSFPDRAYFLDLDDISKPGTSPLLEVPTTVIPANHAVPIRLLARALKSHAFGRRVSQRLLPDHLWLRPNGNNARLMTRVIDHCVEHGNDYVEFMLHSSEFMPGGSPTFPTVASIDRLFADMERLFSYSADAFSGLTLQEYYQTYRTTLAAVA